MGIKPRLVVMNFLQFAVWGSYLVCIGNFLGRVGLGEYISWFYVAQGVVSIFMPAIIGAIADKFVEPQRLLGISHLTAALFMLLAAWFGYEATLQTVAGEATSIGPLFTAYCLSVAFYMPTIALSNTVAFSILKNRGYDTVKDFPPNPTKLTNHMAAMNPTVPKTRIGGKSFTGSYPRVLRIEKATGVDRAMVGL